MNTLRASATETLKDIQKSLKGDKNAELSREYAELLEIVTNLEEMQHTVKHQRYNFDKLATPLEGSVTAYHRESIGLTLEEFALPIEQGHTTLKTMHTAIEALETQYAHQQNKRYETIQIFLGMAAIILALLGVLNHDYLYTFVLEPLSKNCSDRWWFCALTRGWATLVWQVALVSSIVGIGTGIWWQVRRKRSG